jgi:hypothetical protein
VYKYKQVLGTHSLCFDFQGGLVRGGVSGDRGNLGVSSVDISSVGVSSMGNRGSIGGLGVSGVGNSGMSNRGSIGSMGVSGLSNGDRGVLGLGVGGVVDMGLLNDLLDRVDGVGSGDSNGPGDLNGVGSGNVLGDKDLSLNGNGDIDADINVVLVDLELRDNVGLDGGDPGVGPHGSKDLLLDNGVSGCGTIVDRCRGDGSVQRSSDSGDDGGREGSGLNKVLGLSGNIGVAGLGDNILSDLVVLVSGLDLLCSNLDSSVSNDSILGMALNNSGSGSVAVLGLSNSYGSVEGSMSHGYGSSVVGCTVGAGNKGKGDHKSVGL